MVASGLGLSVACARGSAEPPRSSHDGAASASALGKAALEGPPKPPTELPLLPGIGMAPSSKPGIGDGEGLGDSDEPGPACAKDEDCWSKTCCPAAAPEECVHSSRARKCAIVDVQCKPQPTRFTCVCHEGACTGRLAPP